MTTIIRHPIPANKDDTLRTLVPVNICNIYSEEVKMLGFKVPNSNICVDYWDEEEEPCVRFLTHAHKNRIEGITKVTDRIFMSSFSLWYLQDVLKEDIKDNASRLTLGMRHKIPVSNDSKNNKKVFFVTLIDANHCPGSVMYLFEGDFGQVLCTGDFRYSPNLLDDEALRPLIETKSLDILNVDNKFIGEHCTFPPKEETIRDTVELLKLYPEHKVIICIGILGKFDLLKSIAENLKEPIKVSHKFMMIAQKCGISGLFTLRKARLVAHETDMISLQQLDAMKSKMGPTVVLIMSALYSTMLKYGKRNTKDYMKMGLHIIPYSDHSNHSELYDFIHALRPNIIVPICKSSTNLTHHQDIVRNYTIPDRIISLQRTHTPNVNKLATETDSEPFVEDLYKYIPSKSTSKKVPNSGKRRLPPVQCSPLKKSKICNDNTDKEVIANDFLHYWKNKSITGRTFSLIRSHSIKN